MLHFGYHFMRDHEYILEKLPFLRLIALLPSYTILSVKKNSLKNLLSEQIDLMEDKKKKKNGFN